MESVRRFSIAVVGRSGGPLAFRRFASAKSNVMAAVVGFGAGVKSYK